jgi:putative ABC transport system permease protein
MRVLDCAVVAATSLAANPMRSLLTALGIVIGVGAFVAMLAVGNGAQHQIETAIRTLGSNLLVVGNGSRTAGGREVGQGNFFTLTEADAAALAREIPSIQVAAGSVAGEAQLIYGNRNWRTTVRGVTPEYFVARDWRLARGRGFAAEDQSAIAKVVLLGKTVAEQLFGASDPIGETIRIARVPFVVIGVMAEKGPAPWGGNQDDVVYMPLSTAKKRLFGSRQLRGDLLGQITVKAVSADAVKSVEGDIASVLRRRHGLAAGAKDDFFVSNVAEALSARVESSRVMAILLASVAGISLLVGGVGIMNIMLVSVSERTREIGLRMAVGSKPSDVMIQFITEALLLAVVGGLLGTIVGIVGSIVIARVAHWPVLIGPDAIIAATAVSGAVGVFFGYYPARRAAELDPIDALRQE